MKYNPFKTARKSVPPLIAIVIIKSAMEAARSAGIHIDESVLWEISALIYSGVIAFVNWMKNHKRKTEEVKK